METPTKLPFSPSNILARLDELKRWQREQQERLLHQQTQQRELLSTEQRRMCQAFSLDNSFETNSTTSRSNIDGVNPKIDSNKIPENNMKPEFTTSCQELPYEREVVENNLSMTKLEDKTNFDNYRELVGRQEPESKDYFSQISDDSENQYLDPKLNHNSYTGLHNREQILMNNSCTNFDEKPINSTNSFNTNSTEAVISQFDSSGSKPKQKFLKRGEGLARFRMTQEDIARIRSKAKTQSQSTTQNLKNAKYCNPKRTIKTSTAPKMCSNKVQQDNKSSKLDSKPIRSKIESGKGTTTSTFKRETKANLPSKCVPNIKKPPVWTAVSEDNAQSITRESSERNIKQNLLYSYLPPIVENFPKQSQLYESTHLKNAQVQPMSNNDVLVDIQTYEKRLSALRNKRDSDELKIFELLEEKADNSSFCSTSSAFQLLMNQPNISTPRLARILRPDLQRKRCTTPDSELSSNSSPTNIPDSKEQPMKNCLDNQIDKETDQDTSIHVRFQGIDTTASTYTSESDSTVDYSEIVNIPSNIRPKPSHENIIGDFQDDTEWTEQSSDDQSVRTEIDTTLKSVATNTVEIINANINQACNEPEQSKSDTETDSEVVFKSQLLKSRLVELENEIELFRSENAKVLMQKEKLEADRKLFEKNKVEKEKHLADEKIRMEAYFEEEKRKIMKDKMVFEKYSKELKNQPNRKEREEITLLKSQVDDLKSELKSKDSKYGATQARLRTQVKQLEKELAKLKTSNDNLVKENKKLQMHRKRNTDISNTKILHEINRNLSKVLPKDIQVTANTQQKLLNKAKMKKLPVSNIKPNVTISQTTIHSSSSEEFVDESPTTKLSKHTRAYQVSGRNESSVENILSTSCSDVTDNSADEHETNNSHNKQANRHSTLYNVMYPNAGTHSYFPNSPEHNEVKENNVNFDNVHHTSNLNAQRNMLSIEEAYEIKFGTRQTECSKLPSSRVEIGNLKAQRYETTYPDGRKQVRYSNGNIKEVSPDGNMIKLIYYNGDIKETDLTTGTIKYFYDQTKTWHTQFSDGLEILEFVNGQTEKRYKNGSTEIEFPNGAIKTVDGDGNEKWRYADGTVVSSNNKEKIIQLPNGQREIHTDEHKRREYPDGTIKILYPDGTTETRYANGRVRIKDQFGKLLMDNENAFT